VRLADWHADNKAICRVRRQVFIEEQQVPENLEWDGLDESCSHVLATDSKEQPVATARMTPDGHIGRMAVLPEWRQQGVGSAMLKLLVDRAQASGLTEVMLNAQSYATGFYAGHGFEISGKEFMDANIPHRKMILTLDNHR
jgi:predicted GNAT family N-acyltransferase